MSDKIFRVGHRPLEQLHDFSKLKPFEIAALITIRNLILAENGPVDNDPDDISKKCNMRPSKCAAIIAILIHKEKIFLDAAGKLYCKVCASQLESVAKRRRNCPEPDSDLSPTHGQNGEDQGDGKNLVIPNAAQSPITYQSKDNKNLSLPVTARARNGSGGAGGTAHGSAGEARASPGIPGFDVLLRLRGQGLEMAKAACGRADFHSLAAEYSLGVRDGRVEPPDKPDQPLAHFIAWAKACVKNSAVG